MATWTDPTTLATDPDDPVTSELLTATKNNPVAMAEQQSGAPKIATKNLVGSGATGNTDFTVTDFAGAAFSISVHNSGGSTRTISVNASDGTFGTAQILASINPSSSAVIHGYWNEADGNVIAAITNFAVGSSTASVTLTVTSGVTTLRFTGSTDLNFSIHLMPDGGESAS